MKVSHFVDPDRIPYSRITKYRGEKIYVLGGKELQAWILGTGHAPSFEFPGSLPVTHEEMARIAAFRLSGAAPILPQGFHSWREFRNRNGEE